ncbi:ATP synthase subunit I [Pseudorhodoferax sp.]|uniref:ATP synthase subunit I n=1 Tax=Pseudorhodoferax sp. TaxID=1993553 RepID=UPI0039E32017
MDAEVADFKPLTAEEAQRLRDANPALSPLWVIAAQVGAGVLVAVLALAWVREWSAAWSALYGALAVALPAALFVRATHRVAAGPHSAVMLRFAVWELVKLALSVLMLAGAAWLVDGLHWLALLCGVVAALKMYWLPLVVRPKLLKRN